MNKPPSPKVVAEIGCNHKGDMEIAREMIGIAANFAHCDYVKFQKRSNRELLTADEYAAPHPNPVNAYGASYGEHRSSSSLISISTASCASGVRNLASVMPVLPGILPRRGRSPAWSPTTSKFRRLVTWTMQC